MGMRKPGQAGRDDVMAGHSWKIYWNEYGKNAYLYGTELLFHAKNDVEFRNELMPPGTVMMRWFSKVNYQMARVEPELPMIDGEGRYHIALEASADPPGGLLLELVFYDRYDVEIGNRIIRDGEADFRCPLRTYSYEARLINGGVARFHFHSIVITEVSDGEQEIRAFTEKGQAGVAACPAAE